MGTPRLLLQCPGRVVRVAWLQIGTRVEAGTGLIVVEAMKMQKRNEESKGGYCHRTECRRWSYSKRGRRAGGHRVRMKDESITENTTLITAAEESISLGTEQIRNAASSLILHPSSLRILLWDIDGTLIRTLRSGAFKDYTIPMLEAVFGNRRPLTRNESLGMTDLQIVSEALQQEGFTPDHIRERIDHLRASYMEEMRRATGNGQEFFEVLPGVREVLQAVADDPRYHSALLTGNIEPAAYLKMELVGLAEFFNLPGAFGDESHDRRDLPALAAERIRKHLQLDLAPNNSLLLATLPTHSLRPPLRRPRLLPSAPAASTVETTFLRAHPMRCCPIFPASGLVMKTLAEL